MRIPSAFRNPGLFLLAWFGLFLFAIVFDDQVMAWFVAVSAGLPLGLVAAAGWAPFGIAAAFVGLGNVVWPRNPIQGGLGVSTALSGLVVAVQTPVVFNRSSSPFYETLAATGEGRAFIVGAAWAWGPIVAAFLLFLTIRWVLNRWNGNRKRFRDDSWAGNERTLRIIGVAAMAVSMSSLIAAVLTV